MNAFSTTVYQLLSDNLRIRPNKQAIVDGDWELTYAALHAEVDQLASYLKLQGIGRGDRVIIHLKKSNSEVIALFAVAKIGAVVVNVNIQWTIEQLNFVADNCAAKFMILDFRPAQALNQDDLPSSILGMLVAGAQDHGGFYGWKALANEESVAEQPTLDTELAMILYTSGSTGKPKGVMLSHRNIVYGARSVARYLKLSEDDRLLSVLTYSFDYGLNQLTTMMLIGGAIVHQSVAMASEIVNSINKYSITGLAAVPPLWNQIVRLLSEKPLCMPSLRRITNSGGKIPLNILEKMPNVFPCVDIYLMYGLTEAFRSTYLPPNKFAVKMGAIGQAIPGAEIYVIKHGVGVAGCGEVGELVHRGPLISMGYWGQPEASNNKIKPCPELANILGDEPVCYSGDLVRLDEEGDIWFVARQDSMIKCSGFRLSPDEVEDLVSRSGMVGDVVAFGVQHDDLGEVVHVAITPLDGFDEGQLLQYCRRTMPHYMLPRMIHTWPDLMPRTPSGKLAKPEVIKICRERLLSS